MTYHNHMRAILETFSGETILLSYPKKSLGNNGSRQWQGDAVQFVKLHVFPIIDKERKPPSGSIDQKIYRVLPKY